MSTPTPTASRKRSSHKSPAAAASASQPSPTVLALKAQATVCRHAAQALKKAATRYKKLPLSPKRDNLIKMNARAFDIATRTAERIHQTLLLARRQSSDAKRASAAAR